MNVNKYWSNHLHRYLLLVDKVEDRYIMEDFGDEVFVLTSEEFSKLERK